MASIWCFFAFYIVVFTVQFTTHSSGHDVAHTRSARIVTDSAGGNCQLPDHDQCAILPAVCQDASLSHQLCPHLCGFCAVNIPSTTTKATTPAATTTTPTTTTTTTTTTTPLIVGDEQCTRHVLQEAGHHGIGCLSDGCCQFHLQVSGLCPGNLVCCFTADICTTLAMTTTTSIHTTSTQHTTTSKHTTTIHTTTKSTTVATHHPVTATARAVTIHDCPSFLQHDVTHVRVFRSSCYHFMLSVDRGFSDAERDCAHGGGHLLLIKDSATQNFIFNALKNQFHVSGRVWIGTTDRQREGHWVWVDGTPVHYSNWSPDVLGLFKDERNCGTMDVSNGGHWADENCENVLLFLPQSHRYICEYHVTVKRNV